MKTGCTAILLLIAVAAGLAATESESQVKTLLCPFGDGRSEEIYKVFCQVGFATAFELPEGMRIKDFVIGDPGGWKAESNGVFGFVSPKAPGLQTSLSIITDRNELFVFNLVERGLEKVRETTARVRVVLQNDSFFPPKGEIGNREEKEQGRPERLAGEIRRKYKVRGKNFSITRAGDDGVFAYVWLAKAQDRPALFYVHKREGKKKELEPVKFVDKGDYYQIHRCLVSKKERFILKLGKREDELLFK